MSEKKTNTDGQLAGVPAEVIAAPVPGETPDAGSADRIGSSIRAKVKVDSGGLDCRVPAASVAITRNSFTVLSYRSNLQHSRVTSRTTRLLAATTAGFTFVLLALGAMSHWQSMVAKLELNNDARDEHRTLAVAAHGGCLYWISSIESGEGESEGRWSIQAEAGKWSGYGMLYLPIPVSAAPIEFDLLTGGTSTWIEQETIIIHLWIAAMFPASMTIAFLVWRFIVRRAAWRDPN